MYFDKFALVNSDCNIHTNGFLIQLFYRSKIQKEGIKVHEDKKKINLARLNIRDLKKRTEKQTGE